MPAFEVLGTLQISLVRMLGDITRFLVLFTLVRVMPRRLLDSVVTILHYTRLTANKDVSLIMRGRLYSSCVRSSMLHGSETWPVRKENVVALQRPDMRMVRWMCGVKLKDRLPSKELRERLGVDDIALILQQNRLRWHGHVLRKDDDDWVKKCMEYEVEGSRPRKRPKRTWKEVVREDCQARKLNKEDAVDRCKSRKVIKALH